MTPILPTPSSHPAPQPTRREERKENKKERKKKEKRKKSKSIQWGVGNNLTPEEDLFLLRMRVEIPNQPNLDYRLELFDYNGTVILSSFVSDYFA
jgi:ribosomal protein S18